MQTFLPYADFEATAAVLDNARLGKQRVETLQILRALELPDYGWRNHPAVRMWRGRTPALVVYGLACVSEWEHRGFADSTREQIAEFSPENRDCTQSELAQRGLLPGWLGEDKVHRSHQSRLVSKAPEHYRPLFPDAPPDLDYYWPEPDSVGAPSNDRPRASLWVIRPDTASALGSFLVHGVAGFSVQCGLRTDIRGLDQQELRRELGLTSRRRPGRAITALGDFASLPDPGDRIGVEVDTGGRLLTGEIVSDYRFDAKDRTGVQHSRLVRWEELLPRSVVRAPSSLQDVRPFFAVALADRNADELVGS